jgi:hypothetical protein
MRQFTKTVVLTAAQVNDLENTPVNVIPACPAGYQIRLVDFLVSKLSGTAVGSCANDPIALVYTGDTTILAALDAVGAATNSNLVLTTGTAAASYMTANGDIFSEVITGTLGTGKGIDITAVGAAVANFDGTLQVTVSFKIVKLGE